MVVILLVVGKAFEGNTFFPSSAPIRADLPAENEPKKATFTVEFSDNNFFAWLILFSLEGSLNAAYASKLSSKVICQSNSLQYLGKKIITWLHGESKTYWALIRNEYW